MEGWGKDKNIGIIGVVWFVRRGEVGYRGMYIRNLVFESQRYKDYELKVNFSYLVRCEVNLSYSGFCFKNRLGKIEVGGVQG